MARAGSADPVPGRPSSTGRRSPTAPLGDGRPVRRISRHPDSEVDPTAWPHTLAPVRQLLDNGLDLAPGITFLVGENGSGKSTLVEGVAMAFGLGAEGGTRNTRHRTAASESDLSRALHLTRGAGAARWGFFLRAETMHGYYTYLDDLSKAEPSGRTDPDFHAMSHGESFLAILATRFDSPGLYCLDEPEAALSFSSTLALVGLLGDLAAAGSQVLCATHSPVLAATPGATVLQVDADGYREVAWEDLEIVAHWRRFLDRPEAYLRHLR